MAMKGYSSFPKAPELLELHYQIVYCHIQDTFVGDLPLCIEAIGVYYSPSWLGKIYMGWYAIKPSQTWIYVYIAILNFWEVDRWINVVIVILPKSCRYDKLLDEV